jgi:hypothetical protein
VSWRRNTSARSGTSGSEREAVVAKRHPSRIASTLTLCGVPACTRKRDRLSEPSQPGRKKHAGKPGWNRATRLALASTRRARLSSRTTQRRRAAHASGDDRARSLRPVGSPIVGAMERAFSFRGRCSMAARSSRATAGYGAAWLAATCSTLRAHPNGREEMTHELVNRSHLMLHCSYRCDGRSATTPVTQFGTTRGRPRSSRHHAEPCGPSSW